MLEIIEGRIVFEERTDKGVETVIFRIEDGEQRVERIRKFGIKPAPLYAPKWKKLQVEIKGVRYRNNAGLDDLDPRWKSQRAVGSLEFVKRHYPSGRGQRIIPLPEQIRRVRK